MTSDNLIPHVTTTLTVDEREAFLVQTEPQISGFDKVRARETSTGINNLADEMFEQMSKDHLAESNRLAELENEMISLAEMSRNANVEDLIQIADRIGDIELMLGNISESPEYAMLTPITILTPLGEKE